MLAQGRVGGGCRAVLALLAAWILAPPAHADMAAPGLLPTQEGQPLADPLDSDTLRSDARLADVCFVDPTHGWAVGDRGSIWCTEDGGRQWSLQDSGVACRLESVFFLDAQTGWAAGGYSHPYTHTSTGVLLSTRDGGRHWSHDPQLLLPALKRVQFFDPQHGAAVGRSSAMYPSGVLVTKDGGRSWSPLPGGMKADWLAGEFIDPFNGVLAGRRGKVAILRRGGTEPARSADFGLRALTRLRLVPPVYGWLVGQGGLVMLTTDLGATWQAPPADPPEALSQQFDFQALAVRGPKVWVAGSPGTRVLHSPDAGRSWTAFPTGQSLPLEGLCFVDDQHGWAVGELGTILATGDGGQTWQRQRSGGTRAALLAIFSEPRDVPLELLARLSGDEGYLAVVETLARRDVETPVREEVPLEDRLHEAVVNVGACAGCSTWRFPLRQRGLHLDARKIVDAWDRTHDGRGLEELQSHLVRQIRVWRPEVIVTHGPNAKDGDPLGQLVYNAVLAAAQSAADPTAHAEQITSAGLAPWEVKRVYGAIGPGGNTGTAIVTAQLAGRLGRSLADVASGPHGLLQDRFAEVPETLGFVLVYDKADSRQGHDDFFAGIPLFPGSEARRQWLDPPAGSMDLVRRIAEKRRNVQAILRRTEQEPTRGAALLAESAELTRGLDPASAAQVLYHLAERYRQSGQWPAAAETLELLTDRYPSDPLSRAALLWLVPYYASSEAQWWAQGGQRITVQQASAPALGPAELGDFRERAAALGKHLQTTAPGLFAEPAVGFPLAAVDRERGFGRQAERFYSARRRGTTGDAWWACAQGEAWLAEPKGVPPKPVVECVRAAARPRLDGRLDDAVWQQGKPAGLRSAMDDDSQWPGQVLVAYDDQFLYLAVHCREAPGVAYPPGEGVRPRDPDLSAHDRVDVLVDLDRDFVTYFRLTVDHRGWTGEACWGDATWNPTWFVAAAASEGNWTVEAAIPLDQLTGQYPKSRDVWAVGIQRTVPGVGFQSWNTPAATEVIPEGFGYVIFQ